MDLSKSRYLTLARTDTGSCIAQPAGDDLPAAQRKYLDAVAHFGTTEVHLVERVPVILHDGRGAQGAMLRIAERLAYCQGRMIEHGLSARDLARHTQFGEDSILKMFSGEEVKARWVERLVEVVDEMSAEDSDA